ncbi:MAG: M20/M25/M40 family metallo-hydrolase [Oscillospiraceae bacterium]
MDWKKLYDDVDQWAAAHRQEFIDDISEVCRIRSVSIMNKQDPEKPFGAACRQMLDKALEMSGRYGFETRNYDNFCGSAVYGSNPDNDSIGIFSHMDIVPEGEGWTHDPFDPILSEDGKYLFARGTADNKSCGIMAMYAMRYLKEHDIKLKNNVMLVFGMNEEIGMNDIPEFLAREKCPKFSLVPDAKYPITYAEKGITKSVLKSPKMTGNLKDMWSGLAVNAGSPIAWAVLEGVSREDAEKALEKFEKTTVEAVDGGVKITVEKDENKVIRDPIGTWTATARLCKVLAGSGLLTGNGQEVLNWMAEISDDYRGEKMASPATMSPTARCAAHLT